MKGCRPLTEAEVNEVRRSFSGTYAARDKALFILGVKSGFRISELLSLTVGDVSPHGRLVDRVTVARAHMKKKVEGRTVVMHPEAKAALSAWLEVLKADGALLPKGAPTYLRDKGLTEFPLHTINTALEPLGFVVHAAKVRRAEQFVSCIDKDGRMERYGRFELRTI